MYAALLRFAPRNWLTLSLSQAEVVDQVVKEAVDCKEKEEVDKASNNTNENLYLARGCGLGLGGWQHVLFDGQVGGGRDRGQELEKNANILGSNYSDLKFIRFAFLHRRNSIMCVCVIV